MLQSLFFPFLVDVVGILCSKKQIFDKTIIMIIIVAYAYWKTVSVAVLHMLIGRQYRFAFFSMSFRVMVVTF